MNKVYTFDWLLSSIDNSIIFMLFNGEEPVAAYQVNSILAGDMENIKVKFANIDDLNKFISYGIVRFVDVNNSKNIIDIPIKNLCLLYENSNKIEVIKRKRVKLSKLESFAVIDGNVINGDYYMEIVCISDISDEFNKLIHIMHSYSNMSMNDKFDALGDINIINYRMDKLEEVV